MDHEQAEMLKQEVEENGFFEVVIVAESSRKDGTWVVIGGEYNGERRTYSSIAEWVREVEREEGEQTMIKCKWCGQMHYVQDVDDCPMRPDGSDYSH